MLFLLPLRCAGALGENDNHAAFSVAPWNPGDQVDANIARALGRKVFRFRKERGSEVTREFLNPVPYVACVPITASTAFSEDVNLRPRGEQIVKSLRRKAFEVGRKVRGQRPEIMEVGHDEKKQVK